MKREKFNVIVKIAKTMCCKTPTQIAQHVVFAVFKTKQHLPDEKRKKKTVFFVHYLFRIGVGDVRRSFYSNLKRNSIHLNVPLQTIFDFNKAKQ